MNYKGAQGMTTNPGNDKDEIILSVCVWVCVIVGVSVCGCMLQVSISWSRGSHDVIWGNSFRSGFALVMTLITSANDTKAEGVLFPDFSPVHSSQLSTMVHSSIKSLPTVNRPYLLSHVSLKENFKEKLGSGKVNIFILLFQDQTPKLDKLNVSTSHRKRIRFCLQT